MFTEWVAVGHLLLKICIKAPIFCAKVKRLISMGNLVRRLPTKGSAGTGGRIEARPSMPARSAF